MCKNKQRLKSAIWIFATTMQKQRKGSLKIYLEHPTDTNVCGVVLAIIVKILYV